MASENIQRTSPSLLGRLRAAPADEAAWTEFVERYGRVILDWCRRQRLQQADAEDVTQGVLTKLAVRMRTFRYDPAESFRRWLWTVTRHAVADFCSSASRSVFQDEGFFERLASPDTIPEVLSRAFDLELLEEAYERVRGQVEAKTWDAFRLTALEGVSGPDAAARLGMTVGSVYMARSNVQKRLREELQRLEGPDGDAT
ncbi:MAG: RNA polymerase sigma factor [Fimbriiglobus sp.]